MVQTPGPSRNQFQHIVPSPNHKFNPQSTEVQQILLKFPSRDQGWYYITYYKPNVIKLYIKLLSPQALWFRMSSPNSPLLNIFITLRSSFLVFIFHLAKQKPRQKQNQYECGWMRGLLPWFCRQLHPSPCDLEWGTCCPSFLTCILVKSPREEWRLLGDPARLLNFLEEGVR